jgi:hypothetical protein
VTTSIDTQPRARARWQGLAWALTTITAAGLAAAALVAVVVVRATTPREGEWTQRVQLGPWTREVSMPTLVRWATHPMAARVLDGRHLNTRAGRWYWRTQPDGSVRATCTPCTLTLAALGPAPLTVGAAVLHGQRAQPEAWQGTLELRTRLEAPALDATTDATADATADPTAAAHDGGAAKAVRIAWHAKLEPSSLALKASMPDTELASIVSLFAASMPRERHALVQGSFGFDLQARLDGAGVSRVELVPRVQGAVVEGLGTQALANLDVDGACGDSNAQPGVPTTDDDEPLRGWLPRAVIAAEDQRFFEHPGYDLRETLLAWQRNQSREPSTASAPVRGASTITQQLAKLLYTGDERSAMRKLREWLYAVEMERTLGKARILQLYLALAPWGDHVCGADAAARRYVGWPAQRLQPHEAAWLASLLRNPRAQLVAARRHGRVDADTTAHVIEAMRPLLRANRRTWVERLDGWQPAMLKPASPTPSPSQPRAAVGTSISPRTSSSSGSRP